MAEFFSMGGYGTYIWPCYALSFIVLTRIGWHHTKQVKKLRAEVIQLEMQAENDKTLENDVV